MPPSEHCSAASRQGKEPCWLAQLLGCTHVLCRIVLRCAVPLVLWAGLPFAGLGCAHSYISTCSAVQKWYPDRKGVAAGTAVFGMVRGGVAEDHTWQQGLGVRLKVLLGGFSQVCTRVASLRVSAGFECPRGMEERLYIRHSLDPAHPVIGT